MAPFRHRNGHPAEEVLEEYSFGRLHGRDCGEVEEHLMLCEPCRESLAGLETFIQSMKTGILEDRESRAYGRAWGRAAFILRVKYFCAA